MLPTSGDIGPDKPLSSGGESRQLSQGSLKPTQFQKKNPVLGQANVHAEVKILKQQLADLS